MTQFAVLSATTVTASKGATASVAVCSAVEICEANSIDSFKYLVYLFEKVPNTNFKLHPDELDALLSWDEVVQKNPNLVYIIVERLA
ncbi:MAG: transposase domain-containing protein [Selenomonas ruminantium]|nr:transposase domain-containing protein [Selenomonas ruminantium]